MDTAGKLSTLEISKVRSMSEPEVSEIGRLIPRHQDYHFNSEIISSTLYELGKSLGSDNLVDFILWMDKITASKYRYEEGKIRMKIRSSEYQEIKNQYDDSKLTQDLLEIRIEVKTLAHLIKRWSKGNLLENQRSIVEEILLERGL